MDAIEIFRTLGEVAGIGGLGLGLFFLVVREVLKNIPQDKIGPIKSATYMRLLNKMILFSFILAIVGMGTYLVLKVTKNA